MMNKKSFRIEQAIKALRAEKDSDLHFLTLTTPFENDGFTIREMWRALINQRWWRYHHIRYIMVFEKHPGGHGWHIHAVINRFLLVEDLRAVLVSVGFGRFRIDRIVGPVDSVASYVGKYVAKSLKKGDKPKGMRLVNVSRGLTTLRQIEVTSPKNDFVRRAVKDVAFEGVSIFRMFKGFGHLFITFPFYDLDYLLCLGLKPNHILNMLAYCRDKLHLEENEKNFDLALYNPDTI